MYLKAIDLKEFYEGTRARRAKAFAPAYTAALAAGEEFAGHRFGLHAAFYAPDDAGSGECHCTDAAPDGSCILAAGRQGTGQSL